MSNDIITITEATEKQAGPSIKCRYVDSVGKVWHSWKETCQLSAGKTYELQEIETKKWSPKAQPDKQYTDYMIKKAKEVAAQSAANIAQAVQPAQPKPYAAQKTNAHTNGRQKWDRDEVLSARLSLIIGGWAQSGQIALDGQSVARALAALDSGLQIYNGGPFDTGLPLANSEDPGDGMEGTEFGR